MSKILSLLPISPKDVLRKGDSARDNFHTLYWLYLRENKQTAGLQAPITRRIRGWKDWFLTSSTILYDFETYGKEAYLNDWQYHRRIQVNGLERSFTDHKYAFDQMIRHNHAEVLPDLYGVVREGQMFEPPSTAIASSVGEWVLKNLSDNDKIVIKPEDGEGGEDIYIVSKKDGTLVINGESASTTTLDQWTSDTVYVVTEFINQAEYSAEIYPHTTNTVRLLSLWDYENNEPYVADAIHRIGTDMSRPVDNWDKGGLSVAIDLNNGTLGQATRWPHSSTVEWYDVHPDNGQRIKGVEIPKWSELKTAVREMASELWYMPMAAWDITVTKNGFKMLEANSTPTINMMQVHRPLLLDERTRRFFEHHDVL
jgi:hypothetical protein